MRGITSKILLTIGGTFLAIIVLTQLIITGYTRKNFVANETLIMKETNNYISTQVEGYFNRYITIIETMATDQNVESLTKDVREGSPIEQSAYYDAVMKMLEKSQLMESDTILTTSVTDLDSGILIDSDGWVSGADFDCTTREWYKAATEKRVVITEPYEDAASGKQVVTIAAPLYDGRSSDVIGITAVDIEITKMTNLVGKQVLGRSGYIILASPSGKVLSHKNPEMLLKDLSQIGLDSTMQNAIKSVDGSLIKFKNDSVASMGIASTIGNTGWKLISVLPASEFMESANDSQRMLLIIYCICTCLMAAALVAIATVIARPVKKLNEVTQRLADGELDMEIAISSRDEVGNLAGSLSRLIARLREYIVYIDETSSVLKSFSKGDLSVELKNAYTGEFSKLREAILEISDIFNLTIGEISIVSDQVNTGSEQVSSAAQSLSSTTAQQAASVEELTATIENISEQVKSNADSAQSASKRADQVRFELEESNRQMKELSGAMREITESSEQIGKIIKTIEDIAFQTNILALNAAVEAARAGSAGKGFAVVADEVRNLASKSADAAKTTTELIANSIAAIERGSVLSGGAEDSMQLVVEAMKGMTELVNQISQATEQQAISIQQVTQGMDQISSVVQTNSATAEESAAASQELFDQSQILQRLVKRFHLKNNK